MSALSMLAGRPARSVPAEPGRRAVRAPGEGEPPAGVGPVVAPLPGPLLTRPQVSRWQAGQMLRAAVVGLAVEHADRALLARTDRWDPADVAVLASLLWRARTTAAGSSTLTASARWVMTCGPCRLRGFTEPVSQAQARSWCRQHDRAQHEGVVTAQVVEVEIGGGVW